MHVLKKTKSLCPECLKVLDAEIYEDGGVVYIGKSCTEHGRFDDVYWSDYSLFERAEGYETIGDGVENPRTSQGSGCPFDCGICPSHASHTVLAIIDVTNRCNLRCPICFANAAVAGYTYE
ncbi:MAG: radical SAM protein, partial [Candidatus Verstraetearchaeota archaeon]|nr:radical SAM protein [Candidatus Verstraetearchaeota archaeon]